MSKQEKVKASNPQQAKEKKPKPKKEPQQQQQQLNPQDKANANKPVAAGAEQKTKQQQPGVKKQQQPKQKQQQNQPKQQQQQGSKKSAAPKAKAPKVEHEKKEDIFQAVLLADNFSSSIFGPECPLLQEGLMHLINRRLVDYSLESLTSSGVQEIYLYCTTQTEEFRKYIQNSKWAVIPHTTIRVIVGEDALSLGDALRDLDAKGVLRNDFILMNAGVISNIPLRDLLNCHRENVKKDKGAVLTLVHRKLLPGHRSRSKLSNAVIVVDSSSGKILAYDNKLFGKKLNLPIERIGAEMDIYMDCVDTGITVCSSSVPPLFTDNFDFTTIQDAIKEIMINEEILGNSIYLHRLQNGYANRVVDFDTFQGISCDILQRWTYPAVPDMPFSSTADTNHYSMQANFVYKGSNVKIRGVQPLKSVLIGSNSEIGKDSQVHYTSIGNNCHIGCNVIVISCQIGDCVSIPDGSHLTRCILTNGTVLKEKVELENLLLVNDQKYVISQPSEVGEGSDDESDSDSDKSDNISLSSGSDEFEGDQDLQLFSTEVIESLLRGYQASIANENLILEINSSKFAYNMTFKEVTSSICKGILLAAPRLNPDFYEKSTKIQWDMTKDVILKLKNVLTNYVKTAEAQKDLLMALEEYANDNIQFRPLLMQTMHLLYDEDILTEDTILCWHRNTSLYEAGTELRKLVTKLIEWLEAPDSDTEDEDE